ncbi:MAG TPA: PASTA domain-containing protein, partial [Microthrixaceae bacterium]|nr:PASTA domain-containing protein [Microthrixaceae bacterium]
GVVAALALLGAAAAWWFLIRVPVHDVPDLVGRPLAEASALARQNGWKLDDDTVVRVDDTRPGQVVEQSPRSGSTLSEGDTLHVTVSLGPTLVAVPDLKGVPEAEARAQIEAAGLTAGPSSTTTDEEVPVGAVVSAGPAPGQEAPASDGTVPRGTELALVVSSGPAPRVVPDGLVGLSVADAKARLAAVQLGAAVTEVNDEVAPAGMVMAVGTPPGTSVPRDTAVALTVSKGPAPIPVPDVVGLAGTAASAQIQAVGLGVSGIEGSPSNAVLATDPPAGEAIPRGAPVRIFTRR